jgi:hypothetical protein
MSGRWRRKKVPRNRRQTTRGRKRPSRGSSGSRLGIRRGVAGIMINLYAIDRANTSFRSGQGREREVSRSRKCRVEVVENRRRALHGGAIDWNGI